jgi:hypothetical protein
MVTELSPEQCRAIDARPDGPVEFVDPVTKRTYVLVSTEIYRRLQATVRQDDSVGEMAALLASLAPEDWEDAAVYTESQP